MLPAPQPGIEKKVVPLTNDDLEDLTFPVLDADTLPTPRPEVASHRVNDYTIGAWGTEAASAAAFDLAISDHWNIYREVPGVLVQPRPHQINKTMRIDRILAPRTGLIRAGWAHGMIGVELKRSQEKLGPAISQAIDYGRTVFTLNQAGGSRVWLDWVFVWPAPKQSGAMASVLSQNRVGTATPGHHGGVEFKSGENAIVYVAADGTVRISVATNGGKAGRR